MWSSLSRTNRKFIYAIRLIWTLKNCLLRVGKPEDKMYQKWKVCLLFVQGLLLYSEKAMAPHSSTLA